MGNKQHFKLMDDYIIVHSKGKEKNNKILVPQNGSYEQRKQWAAEINEVYAVADNVENIKVGDKILLVAPIKLRGIEKLTEVMEEKLGKKFTVEITGKDGNRIGEEEKEKYFAVKEEDVICVIN